MNINHKDNLPHGLLRYAFRTQETIEVGVDEPNILSQEEYIRAQSISLLCIPLFSHDVMVGCVYIEYDYRPDIDRTKKIILMFSPFILNKRLVKDNKKEQKFTRNDAH